MISVVITHLAVLLVGTLVALLPGLPIVYLLQVRRALHPLLVPAVTLVFSTLVIGAVLAISLLARWPITSVITILAVWTLVSGGIAFIHHRRSSRSAASRPRWYRTVSGSVWGASGLVALAAFIAGGPISSDTLYHAAQSLKLAHLSGPSFANTLMFRTGGAHPGYFIPVWQEHVAITAKLTGAAPVTVMMVMPALLAPMIVWTAGGVLATLMPTRPRAAGVGAVAGALSLVRVDGSGMFVPSWYPSPVALSVVLPVAIACWAVCVWGDSHAARWRSCGVLGAATACILLIHVSYIAWLVMVLSGSVVVWLLLGSARRALARRQLAAAAVVGGVTAVYLGAMWPILQKLGTGTNALEVGVERFSQVIVGAPPSGFHLLTDRLLHNHHALYSLLGLIGVMVIVIARRREPVAYYCAGAALSVLIVSRSDLLFEQLATSLSVPQAVRIGLALPLVITCGALGEVVWDAIDRNWDQLATLPRGVRAAAGIGIIGALCAAGFLVYGGGPEVRTALLEVVRWGLPFLLLGAWLLNHREQRERSRESGGDDLASHSQATPLGVHRVAAKHSKASHGKASVVVLVCAGVLFAPTIVGSVRQLGGEAAHRPETGLNADTLGQMDAPVRDALARDVRTGDVILAGPFTSFNAMAITPAYVVSSAIWHVPDTRANKRVQRARRARAMFRAATPESRRDMLMRREQVRWVIVDRRVAREQGIKPYLAGRARMVARGEHLALYQLNRSEYIG